MRGKNVLRAGIALSLAIVAPSGCSGGGGSGAAPVPGDPVVVTVTLATSGLVVRSGYGVDFSGLTASVAPAAKELTRTRIEAMTLRRNRLHYAGESLTEPNDSRLPEPSQGAWNFPPMNEAVDFMETVREQSGTPFMLECHHAPRWMTAGGTEGGPPLNDDDYAAYCARVFSQYQLGGFTDEGGTFQPSPYHLGLDRFEIWDEPDINDAGGLGSPDFTPAEFITLYGKSAAALGALDAMLQIGGPTVSNQDSLAEYLGPLLDSAAPVDFISFHAYPVDLDMTDAAGFARADDLLGVVTAARALGVSKRAVTLPVVVGEIGVDGEDEPRNAGSYSLAFLPRAYMALVRGGVENVIRWEANEQNYGLLDPQGHARPGYWADKIFWDALQANAAIVGCTASRPEVKCLAVVAAGKLTVIVANSEAERDFGAGYSRDVTVMVAGTAGTPALIGRKVDRNVDRLNGPAPFNTTTTSLDGYGVVVWQQQ